MRLRANAVSYASALLALAAILGCEKPPAREKAAAESVISSAIAEGAKQCASKDLNLALRALDEAQNHIVAKRYDDAKVSLQKATSLAQGALATARTVTRTRHALEEAWKKYTSILQRVDKARALLSSTQVWTGTAADIKDQLTLIENGLISDAANAESKLSTSSASMAKLDSEIKATFESSVRNAMRALESASVDERLTGAQALGRIGPDAQIAVTVLAEKTRWREPGGDIWGIPDEARLAAAAADALGEIGPAASGAIPDLCSLANTSFQIEWKFPIAERAAIALGAIGPGDRRVIQSLSSVLRNRSMPSGVAIAAANSLGSMGKQADLAVSALRDCKMNPQGPYTSAVSQACDRALIQIRGW